MGYKAGRSGPINTDGGRPFQISDDPSASMRAGLFFVRGWRGRSRPIKGSRCQPIKVLMTDRFNRWWPLRLTWTDTHDQHSEHASPQVEPIRTHSTAVFQPLASARIFVAVLVLSWLWSAKEPTTPTQSHGLTQTTAVQCGGRPSVPTVPTVTLGFVATSERVALAVGVAVAPNAGRRLLSFSRAAFFGRRSLPPCLTQVVFNPP